MKISSSFKDIVKRVKRKSTDWEEILTIQVSEKELLSRTYPKILQKDKWPNEQNGQMTQTDISQKKINNGQKP